MHNQAVDIRQGEDLPSSELLEYLNQHLQGAADTLTIKQYPAGFSNLTYLIGYAGEEYVLRRPPHRAQVRSGHDMVREFTVLDKLQTGYRKAPRPVLLCTDHEVMGVDFYLMEKVDGLILRANKQSDYQPSSQEMTLISEELVDTLVELHLFDWQRAGLTDFGRPLGYVQRQVEGWTKRYHAAATDQLKPMEELALWLQDHMPAAELATSSLIHNDFKYDNVVLDPKNLTIQAVLDWEMCTLGDPLMDLGTSLGYWVDPEDPPTLKAFALSPTLIPGNLSREQVVERYFKKMQREPVDMTFYYAFGLFKIGVIVQQIYFRYRKGFTKDQRFAQLGHVVKGLAHQGCQVTDKGRVSRL